MRPAIFLMTGLFSLLSCSGKLDTADAIDLSVVPVQQVRDLFVIDAENGRLNMRMESGMMERYETDTSTYELFKDGFRVFAYNEDGDLESTIFSDRARHTKNNNGDEIWMVTGNVSTNNIKNQEVLESDTIYWNRTQELYWTDSYVKMYSPDGFIQGYGMRSDQRSHHTVINKPFNSYAFVEEAPKEDTVNFIGPMMKK